MAVRDILVLNTTSSRLEAQQSSDTVRILGTSDQLLSIEQSRAATLVMPPNEYSFCKTSNKKGILEELA